MSKSRRSIGECPKYSLFLGNTAISEAECNLGGDDDDDGGDEGGDEDRDGDGDGGGDEEGDGGRTAICWPHLISGPHGSLVPPP